MHDVLTNLETLSIPCLDHGHVRLVDCSPRLVPDDQKTADFAIVRAARVSYGDGTKSVSEDRTLLRYLFRHAHTTPLEMVEFTFHCKMPIFVARQWIRHRTASVNEISGRYSVVKDEFYVPRHEDIRAQSTANKQGGGEEMSFELADQFNEDCRLTAKDSYESYMAALDNGVSREQARIQLPLSLYTEWYWKIDLHNLFHFLALRCDSHAQYEIRVFADAMLKLITPIVPVSVEAWNDYHPMRGAQKFSRLELEALAKMIWQKQEFVPLDCDNTREQVEWEQKVKALRVLGQYQEDVGL